MRWVVGGDTAETPALCSGGSIMGRHGIVFGEGRTGAMGRGVEDDDGVRGGE